MMGEKLTFNTGSMSALLILLSALGYIRVNFELEPGAVGNTTDFNEANKRIEWGLKKARISFPFNKHLSHSSTLEDLLRVGYYFCYEFASMSEISNMCLAL